MLFCFYWNRFFEGLAQTNMITFFSVETRPMNTKGPPFLSLFYDKHGSHLHGEEFLIAIKISKIQMSHNADIVYVL